MTWNAPPDIRFAVPPSVLPSRPPYVSVRDQSFPHPAKMYCITGALLSAPYPSKPTALVLLAAKSGRISSRDSCARRRAWPSSARQALSRCRRKSRTVSHASPPAYSASQAPSRTSPPHVQWQHLIPATPSARRPGRVQYSACPCPVRSSHRPEPSRAESSDVRGL